MQDVKQQVLCMSDYYLICSYCTTINMLTCSIRIYFVNSELNVTLDLFLRMLVALVPWRV